MSFLQNPRLLLVLRLVQFFFALAFLVVIAYSNTHKGNWTALDGPVALGVIATLFTLVISGHGVWRAVRSDFIKIHGRVYTIARMLVDFIIFLMWIGTATLMLRPHQYDATAPPGLTGPYVPWAVGIAFSFVEIVVFVLTTILVFTENKGANAAPSAAYV